MSTVATARPLWRRLIGFNLLTATALGVGGFFLGWFIGDQIQGSSITYYSTEAGQNDLALLLGYGLGIAGFLVGLGFANYPLSRMLGRPASLVEKDEQGLQRYFGLCTDHKVIGMQYLVGIGVFFFIGGVNAMLIRTELLQPSPNVFPPDQYLTLVGLHGTMMIGLMSSVILGPFGNYFVPLMIGARRVAFPRTEALTFWLLMAGGVILTSTVFFGGFPTGWTGYAPLSDQGQIGMDSYLLFFALVGISMMLLGLKPAGDDHHPARAGDDLVAPADLLLERRRDHAADGARSAGGADRDAADGGDGPHRADGVLHPRPGREPLPVPEPLLGVWPPGGLRARAARVWDRARAAAGVHAQAAVELSARRGRHARGQPDELLRLAAPPVLQWHQRGLAALLHAFDGDHLDPHRVHLPGRDGHRLARANCVSACRCSSASPGSSTS